ncbi:hypothetical protein HY477_03715 [Candidatus Uhrbacteria bacterium]|nr:hypothetical protein [Candidatus Uhrbacteria bacterium]
MQPHNKSGQARPSLPSRREGSAGQGLIETIVAIGVITTGLFSVITLVVSNLTTQREAAIRYQATNLAREGLELARNLRDTNWLQGNDSWDGMAAGSVAPEFAPTMELPIFAPGGDERIYRDADGVYLQTGPEGGRASNFRRLISLRQLNCGLVETMPCDVIPVGEPSDNIAMEVISTVEWEDAGRARSVRLRQILYDWR